MRSQGHWNTNPQATYNHKESANRRHSSADTLTPNITDKNEERMAFQVPETVAHTVET